MKLTDLPIALLNDCGVDEAQSELQREFQVREKCFPKWVDDGRMTKYDAKDRLRRMAAAIEFLGWLNTYKDMIQAGMSPDSAVDLQAHEAKPVPSEGKPF